MKGGMVGEFDSPAALVAAVQTIRRAGYRSLETYTPYPIEELLEGRRPRTPLYALVFGLTGAVLAYLLQWWTTMDYPLNVGSFPLHSAPAFIPITFESGILAAATAVFFGTMYHLGLPRLDHPLFDVPDFERASVDRFFVAVDAGDELFEADRVAQTLRDAGALRAVPFGRIA